MADVPTAASPQAPNAPAWQLRLIGSAIGSLTAVALALITLPLYVTGIVGAFGIPTGAIVGALFAPHLIARERYGGMVLIATGVAWVLGSLMFSVWWAAWEGRSASPADLTAFLIVGMTIGLAASPYSVPMALIAAILSAVWVRRVAPRSAALWPVSLAVVAVVIVAASASLIAATANPGDAAAESGDRVPFEYLTINESRRPDRHTLELRSYWDGKLAAGSGAVTAKCASGTADLQSDWAIWVLPQDGPRQDRPPGEPVVSAADFTPGEPVRLTVRLDFDGKATWNRGIDEEGC